ncbi:SMI1/KNR4 family protein [Actinoplanes sp. Pm04-4]|uniref:SMI1/KNR4 family protein n=1 Tax=Paractinoplanes pyxinae TaxID=2997416 RepID=A0ABT4AS41_9ACTN|nr:SMI1/KNR4 family protein [Actinoplanes pyxinae]MCY1137058.1 SMI1/KNR4 family protein [Actinoplanes pyxinae]
MAGRWSVIVDWLQRHCAGEAAQVRPGASEAAQVRPGASEAVLAAAQREVGVPFPADLLEWWRAADGMEWAFERAEWPSVGAMIDETAEALTTGIFLWPSRAGSNGFPPKNFDELWSGLVVLLPELGTEFVAH